MFLSLSRDLGCLLKAKRSKYQPAVCRLHTVLRKTGNTIFCGFYANLTFLLSAAAAGLSVDHRYLHVLVLRWQQPPGHPLFIICYQHMNSCQTEITHMHFWKFSRQVYVGWRTYQCLDLSHGCTKPFHFFHQRDRVQTVPLWRSDTSFWWVGKQINKKITRD